MNIKVAFRLPTAALLSFSLTALIALCALNLNASVSHTVRAATPRADSVAQRIRRVENGLLPTVLPADPASAKMNLAERMKHWQVPGVSIAVINNYRVEWARGYGVRNTQTKMPVTAESLFQAASISKPVAAMAMLRLVDAGKLDLDEDVNLKLTSWQVPDSEFMKNKKVTLRGIVSHGAGLTVHGFRGYASDEQMPTLLEVLKGETPANSKPVFVDLEPGSKWRYSGGGYSVMQQLMIDLTNKPFPQLMKEAVLDRVSMKNSTYQQPLPKERWHHAATGYRAKGEAVKGQWHAYPEMAAAGLWTTPTDLAKLAVEVQKSYLGKSNKVLSQKMTGEMLTPQIGDYGLGFRLTGEGAKARFSHGGANEGFRCQLVAFTNTGQGAVIMTNSDTGVTLILEILRSIAAEYGWADTFRQPGN